MCVSTLWNYASCWCVFLAVLCIVVVHHFPPSLSYLHSTEISHSGNWKSSLPRLDKIASHHVELRILVAAIQRCVYLYRHRTCSVTAWNWACPEVQVWVLDIKQLDERAALPWSTTCSLFLLRNLFSCSYVDNSGARSGAVRWYTALPAGRSWVRFTVVSLEFFIDTIIPSDSASSRNE
jgi:hypothetical protein